MLRIFRKSAASMEKTGGSSPADRYGVFDDDLSTWEFVDVSTSDDEDLYSFDGDDAIDEEDGIIGDGLESQPVQEEDDVDPREPRDFLNPEAVISVQSLSVSPPMTFPLETTRDDTFYDDGDGYDEDDEGRDLDDCDVDDELVPWNLKHRLGKQRIRKMGKRGGPKLNKSKKLPYYHNRPGCLYGKHGFGVQHAFI